MKRFIHVIIGFLLIALFFFTIQNSELLAHEEVIGEHIENFDTTITVNKDGTIDVIEQIAYDFGTLDRHGIFRTIPYVKTNSEGKKYEMDIQLISVKDEKDNWYKYSLTKNDTEMQIKIGDPNSTITGQHLYVITYKVGGALTYFSDHDELYWNSTGNDWTVPIAHSRTEAILPATDMTGEIKATCFTGYGGSTEKLCDVTINDNKIVITSQDTLSSSQGLTVVVGFPIGLVAQLEPKEIIPFFSTPFGRLVGAISIVALFLGALFWYILYPLKIVYNWLRRGRDPRPLSGGPVKAWFDAPLDKNGRHITPAETGSVYDERADTHDVFSMIVDFARRGYLTIKEEKKNTFSLIKKKEPDSEMQAFERTFFYGIFGTKSEVNLKTARLAEEVEQAKNDLYDQLVKDGFFDKSPQKTRVFYMAIWIVALTTFNIPLFLAALIFGMNMPAKTILGSEAKAVAQSLKNFLSSQERQLKFQAEKQMMFEKLLPYAIVFGVEKIWIERFEKMGIANPDWYEGYEGGRFNSHVFYHAMTSSYSSLNRAATPTSSSSGFSSGFSSGGGSSGGGGGGGGGGSW